MDAANAKRGSQSFSVKPLSVCLDDPRKKMALTIRAIFCLAHFLIIIDRLIGPDRERIRDEFRRRRRHPRVANNFFHSHLFRAPEYCPRRPLKRK